KGDNGTGTFFEGVVPNLQRRFENTESEWVQHKLIQYMSDQPCPVCNGKRLKPEALAVRLHTSTTGVSPVLEKQNGNGNGRDARSTVSLPGFSIDDVTRMTVLAAKDFFEDLKLGSEGAIVAEPIVREIGNRLGFMVDVGLGYLTL